MKLKVILCISLFLFGIRYAKAQNIEALGSQEPFTIHGSIGGGMNFFSSNEQQATRDPFSWNLHGSLTPSVYGFAIPLAFSVTQFSKSYSIPFSQFGLSPTYKWIKLHLGYRSISFSPFVFNGQSFLGAGIELNPRSFYFAAFYGRLNKAISEDTTIDRHIEPQYARRGYGVKIGLKNEKRELYLEYFHARDDTASIHRYNDSTSTLAPESNNILGGSWRIRLFNILNFSGDVAVSLWNRNMDYAVIDSIGDTKISDIANKLDADISYSSVLSWSGQAQLGLNLNHLNAMIGYRRVEPDFKSLGIPYMLNDIEMINGNVGTNLFKGKLNINAGFTTQHNNLRNMLSSKLVSTTGNLSANAFISQHFNLNANLTTAKIFQRDGLKKLTDSTRMNQLMLTLVVSPSVNFSGNGLQHSVSGSLAFTNLDDKNPMTTDQASGKNINTSANYALYFLQKFVGVSGGFQYSTYQQKESSYNSLGVNVGANTQLLKSRALSLQGNVGYFINKSSDSPTGNNITFSFNGNFSAGKHHSFGAFASYVITPPVNLNPLNDINNVPYAVNSKILSGGLTYSYNF